MSVEIPRVVVPLRAYETLMGAEVGIRRRVASVYRGRRDNVPGADSRANGWGWDIDGALGELVVAKALGIFYDGSLDRFRGSPLGDVGPLQVRTTTEPRGRLLIRDHDADDERFILVLARCPEYEIVGSILGRDAKQDRWRDDPGGYGNPCWAIPQDALREGGS